MKKGFILVSMLFLTACTSLNLSKPKDLTGEIRDLLIEGSKTTEEKVELEQQKFVLTTENVSQVLASVREEVRKNEKVSLDENAKKVEIYAGKMASIKGESGIRNLKMALSPRRASYSLKAQKNTIAFRSIYQGVYLISWEDFIGNSKQVQIENILKYKFTAEENYAIISRNFQDKNLKKLQDAVSLYQISFPEGKQLRQSMLLLLQLAREKEEKKTVKEALQYWNSLQGFSAREEEQIALAKELLGESKGNVEPELSTVENPDQYNSFKTLYQSGNRKETLKLYEGAVSDYLSALALNQNFKETAQLYQSLGNSYFGLGKYQESAEAFQKSLASQTKQEKNQKGAELYYKLASAYRKLGNKTEYIKYLNILKQAYPNTLWGRKAQIELMKLN